MGFGGELMLGAAIREIQQAFPDKNVYLKCYSYSSWLAGLCCQWRIPKSSALFNNPYLATGRVSPGAIVIDTDDPRILYISQKEKDKYIFKKGRHHVDIICSKWGVTPKSIKPDIFLTGKEFSKARRVCAGLPDSYICIEPHGKTTFTPNRLWFGERWQSVVDRLKSQVSIVQVGEKEGSLLDGVVDMRGVLSFRETSELLKNARMFIGTIGGLMHLARAVATPSVILYSRYEPVEVASYSENCNMYQEVDCAECGLRIPCPHGRKCMKAITVERVCTAVAQLLKEV